MNKCKHYPECECHNDWENSAKEIDAANAELFVTAKQEIKTYLDSVEWIEYQPLYELINGKLELMPEKLGALFISKIFPFMEFHYCWKIPEKSNVSELRTALIAQFSDPERQREAEIWKNYEPKTIDSSDEFLEMLRKTNDFEPLKKYIRDNYLNIYPNNFTLKRLKQIKRNINTWKLKLKDLNEAPEIQEFISETIVDIDLKIERYLEQQPTETAKMDFLDTIKKEEESEFFYMGKKGGNELQTKIENEIAPLKHAFNHETDFYSAVKAIQNFFTGEATITGIFVKNGNIKNLAFALGEIWRSQKNEVINLEYLQFYKNTFSIFDKQNIDESNIFGCNLYKYSISKT